MTEAAIVEAVRAVSAADRMQMNAAAQTTPVADPAAIDAFQAAMAVDEPEKVASVPFADQIAATWRTAENAEQIHLHRMNDIAAPGEKRILSAMELASMQYELVTMNFNLEMTLSVAKKTSDAVTTLIKNG